MNKLVNFSELACLFDRIKQFQDKLLTNFYIEPFRHNLWISKGELSYIQFDGCIFLLKDSGMCKHLFYIASNLDSLGKGISSFIRDINYTSIVDVVYANNDNEISCLFEKNGFKVYTTLHRMCRLGNFPPNNVVDRNVGYADDNDATCVKSMLDNNFNHISEQIPELEEILNFAKKKQIMVYKADDRVLGFVIYEIMGITLYWRYWFILPEFRNLHIGSKLVSALMYHAAGTKRQILWVIPDNENAIKRHLHYGYKPEDLYDCVLIK